MNPENLSKIIKTENLKRVFIDKKKDAFVIRPANKNDFSLLLKMYDDFEPKQCAQGIPPADPILRKKLVQDIINKSLSVVAETEHIITGHACLIDIEPGIRAELEIAVHQNWRDRGLGSVLLSLIIDIAQHCAYSKIWLSVDNTNRRAVHIYQSHGFEFIGPFDSEREMELNLK